MTNAKSRGAIVIYRAAQGPELKVRLADETVWLSQKQAARLFKVDVRTINEHVKNIYKSKELSASSTIRNFRIVQKEGGREVTRDVQFYNLDMVISIGYRVSSRRATQFRVWATKTLRNYLIRGYAINEKRLREARDRFQELQETLIFLREKSKRKLLAGQEQEIINLMAGYTRTLTLLEQYDRGKVKTPRGKKAKIILLYDECKDIIERLQRDLAYKKEAGALFGQEREGAFESILKNLYQTFGGKELYSTLEEKAAHLLYFTVKDHPFSDGNKRIGSFLFIYFLDKAGSLNRNTGEKKINDNALAALALLIAESDPKEKGTMTKIIMNLIAD